MSASQDDSGSWEDTVISDRMAVDREFQDRVNESSFSNQGWELVMTAVEFEIVNPEDPEQAHIVAKSEHIDSVLPALKEAEKEMGGPQRGGSSFTDKITSELRGLFNRGKGDAKRKAEAEELAGEYANELHARLKRQGKWNRVCETAAGGA